MCGFCNVWACVCVGFVKCGCVYAWVFYCTSVCMCGFCNVWVCVCMGFVMHGCVRVGFVLYECVYVWVL